MRRSEEGAEPAEPGASHWGDIWEGQCRSGLCCLPLSLFMSSHLCLISVDPLVPLRIRGLKPLIQSITALTHRLVGGNPQTHEENINRKQSGQVQSPPAVKWPCLVIYSLLLQKSLVSSRPIRLHLHLLQMWSGWSDHILITVCSEFYLIQMSRNRSHVSTRWNCGLKPSIYLATVTAVWVSNWPSCLWSQWTYWSLPPCAEGGGLRASGGLGLWPPSSHYKQCSEKLEVLCGVTSVSLRSSVLVAEAAAEHHFNLHGVHRPRCLFLS